MTENSNVLGTMQKKEFDHGEVKSIAEDFMRYRGNLNGALDELRTGTGLVVAVTSTENGSSNAADTMSKTAMTLASAYDEGTIDRENLKEMETIGLFEVQSLVPSEIDRVLHTAEEEFKGIKGIDTNGYVIIDVREKDSFTMNAINLETNERYEATFPISSY